MQPPSMYYLANWCKISKKRNMNISEDCGTIPDFGKSLSSFDKLYPIFSWSPVCELCCGRTGYTRC